MVACRPQADYRTNESGRSVFVVRGRRSKPVKGNHKSSLWTVSLDGRGRQYISLFNKLVLNRVMLPLVCKAQVFVVVLSDQSL